MKLSIEETNLVCIYNTGTRQATITEMAAALPYINDPELTALTRRMIDKLQGMTDDDYARLDLDPIGSEDD